MQDNDSLLIPQDLLEKSNKILFLTHCALGDFTYLQNYFRAFSLQYPHIKIHFWADEVRRTYFFWRWKYLKNYILYDWLRACPFFEKLYTSTYSWPLFNASIIEAQHEEYPIIVSLCSLRSRMYAGYARRISPKAYIAGIGSKHGRNYNDLNVALPYEIPAIKQRYGEWHVTDIYNYYFEQLFGVTLTPEERIPFIEVPQAWKAYGKKQCARWGVLPNYPLVFINPFAKDKKRSWNINSLIPLVNMLLKQQHYANPLFIINAPPQYYEALEKIFFPDWRGRVFLFKGSDNFFQMPSLLQMCDLIISVETSIMHFAVALKKPLVALMRLKNPEWVPLGHPREHIVFADSRSDWISSISHEQVAHAVSKLRSSFIPPQVSS